MAGNNVNMNVQAPRCDYSGVSDDGSSLTCDGSHVEGQGSEKPIVFQCLRCNFIVGDSTSWVTADEEMRTITICLCIVVTGMQQPVIKEDMVTSKEGKDRGSTYQTLLCQSCNIPIGKVYCTTTRELDSMRDLFTLDIDRIKSYSLGQIDEDTTTAISSENLLKIPSAQFLHVQLRKAQTMLLTLTQRVQVLETRSDVSPHDFANAGKRKRRDMFN